MYHLINVARRTLNQVFFIVFFIYQINTFPSYTLSQDLFFVLFGSRPLSRLVWVKTSFSSVLIQYLFNVCFESRPLCHLFWVTACLSSALSRYLFFVWSEASELSRLLWVRACSSSDLNQHNFLVFLKTNALSRLVCDLLWVQTYFSSALCQVLDSVNNNTVISLA